MRAENFRSGLVAGIPIAVGYFSVSVGIGLMAVQNGIPALLAVIISATNLTSAGQVAGISVIAASGGIMEMVLTQLVINARYALMGITLSQKLNKGFSVPERMLAAFGLTDEIFAVASSKQGDITAEFMYGLMVLPFIGWVSGTLFGALAGDLLPPAVTNALGIAIYGMFIAIVMPVARQKKSIMVCAFLAALFSCIMEYVPVFSHISSGFSVIICSVAAAAVAAAIWPLPKEQ